MLFLAIVIAVVACVAAVFYNPIPPPPSLLEDAAANKRHFTKAFFLAFAMVAELLAAALLDAFLPDESTHLRLAMMIGMLVIFAALVMWVASAKDDNRATALPSSAKPLLSAQNAQSESARDDTKRVEAQEIAVEESLEWDEQVLGPKDYTLCKAMMDANFWLQFFSFCFAGGSGLVIINNIAQINLARGGSHKLKDVFVSFISIFNCAGRLGW
eukprot:SAG31_NODE_5272_length_2639_cov_1.823228_2_plen_214_part_00